MERKKSACFRCNTDYNQLRRVGCVAVGVNRIVGRVGGRGNGTEFSRVGCVVLDKIEIVGTVGA